MPKFEPKPLPTHKRVQLEDKGKRGTTHLDRELDRESTSKYLEREASSRWCTANQTISK